MGRLLVEVKGSKGKRIISFRDRNKFISKVFDELFSVIISLHERSSKVEMSEDTRFISGN